MITHCCHCLLGMLIENQQFESRNSFLVLRNYILVVKNLLRALQRHASLPVGCTCTAGPVKNTPDSQILCHFGTMGKPCSWFITLHDKLSSAVYCNRSCLCVVHVWVCYHDNSKLRASIFTKLGLWVVTISSGLNFGHPMPPGRGSVVGKKIGSALLQPARNVCVTLGAFFIHAGMCASNLAQKCPPVYCTLIPMCCYPE